MDKLIAKLTPGRSASATVAILTVLGWVNQMEFETENGRIAKAGFLLGGALLLVALNIAASLAPSPNDKQ